MVLIASIGLVPVTYAQVPFAPVVVGDDINLNTEDNQPCFLQKYNHTVDIIEECGFYDDWLNAVFAPLNYITGGMFLPFMVGITMFVVWLTYGKLMYPVIVGVAFLPVIGTLFPADIIIKTVMLVAAGIGLLLIYTLRSTIKE